jgi:CheY-like chemotaxis protein
MATYGRLVFLVDDDGSVRKALRRVLVASGFQVKVFADSMEFLDAVAAQQPDCLVIDLHMPGLTGLDVLRQLIHLDPRAPAIVITAHDEPDTREQCISAGAKAYLCKPLDAEVLIDTIEQVSTQGLTVFADPPWHGIIASRCIAILAFIIEARRKWREIGHERRQRRNNSPPGQHLRIHPTIRRSPRHGGLHKLSRSGPASEWKLVLYYHPAEVFRDIACAVRLLHEVDIAIR